VRRALWTLAVTLLGVLAIIHAPAAADPHSSGLIQVDAFVRGEGSTAQVVATVRNLTNAAIDTLRVELWGGGKFLAATDRTALPAKQSTVITLSTDKPDESYLIVTARSDKISDQVAMTPLGRPKADLVPDPLLVAVTTSLLSLLGVGLGSILTHVTTYRREKHRMRFEARKSDTERYAPAYREFLDYWRSSISLSQLESGFGQMRSKAFVPENILTLYNETVTTLRDTAATADTKKAAAQRLYAAIDELTGTKANAG